MTHYQAYDKSSYSFYKLQIQAYLDNIDTLESILDTESGFDEDL